MILFGEDFRGGSYKLSEKLYGSPILDAAWGHGFVSVGDVDIGSAMYVAGYATKKIGDKDTFNIMSKRPGIGHSWLDKFRDDVAQRGFVTIEGKRYPIPKTYMDWYPDNFDDIKLSRLKYVEAQSPDDRWFRRTHNASRETNYKAAVARRTESL